MDDKQGEDEENDDDNNDEELEKSIHHTNFGSFPLAQTDTSFPVLYSH